MDNFVDTRVVDLPENELIVEKEEEVLMPKEEVLMKKHEVPMEEEKEANLKEQEEVLMDGFVGECEGGVVDIRNVEIRLENNSHDIGHEVGHGHESSHDIGHRTMDVESSSRLDIDISPRRTLYIDDDNLEIDVSPRQTMNIRGIQTDFYAHQLGLQSLMTSETVEDGELKVIEGMEAEEDRIVSEGSEAEKGQKDVKRLKNKLLRLLDSETRIPVHNEGGDVEEGQDHVEGGKANDGHNVCEGGKAPLELSKQAGDETEEVINEGDKVEDIKMNEKITCLQDVSEYLRGLPSVSSQLLHHDLYGQFIKISPVKTSSFLVDEAGVRVNVYIRENNVYAETLSYSRSTVGKTLVNRVLDLRTVVEDMLHRFQYCQGAPSEYINQFRGRLGKGDIKQIMLNQYNNNIVMRSNKCPLVVDREKEEENFLAKQVRCGSCQSLTDHLIDKYVLPALIQRNEAEADVKTDEETKPHLGPDLVAVSGEDQCQLPPPPTEDACVENPPAETEVECPKRPTPPLQRRGKRKRPEGETDDFSKRMRCNEPDCHEVLKDRQAFKQHRIMHRVKLEATMEHKCTECNKVLNSRRQLEVHMKKHAGKTEQHCDVCEKVFKTAGALKLHIRSIHQQERHFLCNDCGSTFKGNSALIDHRKRIHLQVKLHMCDFCNKEFFSRKDYFEHTRTHTGEKPHQCQLCGKCFSRGYHLKRHSDNVHKHQGNPNIHIDAQDGRLMMEVVGRPLKKQRKKGKAKGIAAGTSLLSTNAAATSTSLLSTNLAASLLSDTDATAVSNPPVFQGGPAEVGRMKQGEEDPLDLALRISEQTDNDQQKDREFFIQRHQHLVQRLQAKNLAALGTTLGNDVTFHPSHHQHGEKANYMILSAPDVTVGSLEHKLVEQKLKIPTKYLREDTALKPAKVELEKTDQSWIFYDT